jgi:exonuclease SbcC
MKLTKITLKNIRSYKQQEILFPSGSILLSGDVGSGKTTILLAIEYALFGLQPGQRGSALLASAENEGSIELELEINGSQVIIERTLKRGTKGVTQESATLSVNGSREELSVTELKSRVLALLNYPEEFVKKTNILYRYTVYAPQEEMKQIILESEESRLNVLRHIFGIEKYKKIKENLVLVGVHLREQSRIIQSEIKDIEHYKLKIEEHAFILNATRLKIETADRSVYDSKNKRRKIEEELKALEEKVAEKRNFEKEIEKANLARVNKASNLADYDRELVQLENTLKIKEEFSQTSYDSTIASIQKNKAELNLLQAELLEITSRAKSLQMKKQDDIEKRSRIFSIDICPTCLQSVSEGHKHNILNETETETSKLTKEIEIIASRMQELRKTEDSIKKELDASEKQRSSMEILRIRTEEVKKADARHKELLAIKESVKKDILSLESHLSVLKKSVFEFSKFDNQFRLKSEELKESFRAEKNAEIALAEIRKEQEFLLKEKDRMYSELSGKEKSRARLAVVLELEKWLSEDFASFVSLVERNILMKVREEFSRLFNKWFSMLTTDSFYVQLDENFTPIILQRDFELSYEFLSGGERTAVALAYRLALNQIINSLHSRINTQDLIILDEPTDGFSDAQLDKVRDILKEINVTQLLIVSHEQKIEGFVDNIIRIKKENGYSFKE